MSLLDAWWNRAPPLPQPGDPLLDRLWARFVGDVPAAAAFGRLAARFGNDHVALRTLARPGSGVALLAGVFERRGWRSAGDVKSPAAHLRTIELARAGHPRMVIAELDPVALPAEARAALARLPADAPPPDDDDALGAWFKAPLPPSGADLDVLDRASPVGAWLLAFGRRPHHFAASVADIEQWHERLAALGVEMNGTVQGAEGAPLRRAATRKVALDVLLRDGTVRARPFGFLELVERAPGFDDLGWPCAVDRLDGSRLVEDASDGKRRYPRVATMLHVDLGHGGLRVPVTSENVSLGGMFLQLSDEDAPAANAVLQLRIDLPGGAVDALATVVYQLPGRGVGVEFQWWDDENNVGRQALAAHLRSLG